MRQLYYKLITYTYYLKNGETFSSVFFSTKRYGEIPLNKKDVFTTWRDYIASCSYSDKKFLGEKTFFKKRLYVNIWLSTGNHKRIYKDDFLKLEIEVKHIPISKSSYPSIHDLSEILSFDEYTQLIFDREENLKSCLTEN